MKSFYRYSLFLAIVSVMALITFSCSEDEEGEPVIHYVRVTNPASSDSLLSAAFLGDLVAIIGDNLSGVQQVWFDDQQASLNSNLVTKSNVIVNVPADAPLQVTDKLTLVFHNGKRLDYNFKVAVPAPVVTTMKNEWVQVGETGVIQGDYFFEPLTITFANGQQVEPATVDVKEITFTIPEGAEPGPVTVKTNFGETASGFHYMDQRNIFLNYDDLTAAGSWRPGPVSNEGGIDGNYVIIKGKPKKNERAEDYPGGTYTSEFWAKSNGRPEGNLVPAEGFVSDYAMKFEARVIDMYGSTLNIAFAPWDQSNNSELWSNLNAKAIWEPWRSEDKNFKTDGWITVTIPLADFKYAQTQEGEDIIYEQMDFNRNITGSLSFWVIGSPQASPDGSPVEIHIDNVRVVKL